MADSTANTDQPNPTSELERARALLQDGHIAEAADAARQLLVTHPGNADALYLLAVCQRYAKQPAAALDTLRELQQQHPGYGRAFQEEGHTHLAMGNPAAALPAFQHAVTLNNSLIASWNALARLLGARGDSARAAEAMEQFRRLEALPDALLAVRNMTAEGRYFDAEQLCRRFLKANPRHVEGMRLLADLGVKSGVLDDAEFILESAVAFEPANRFARQDYVNVLYRRQKYAAALEQARVLRDSDPGRLEYQVGFANQCVAVGDFETALGIYDHAIVELPDNPELHLVHGHALKTVGRIEPAVAAYRRAYAARNSFGDAYWSLANLKTYRFTPGEVELMTRCESEGDTGLDDRVHLCFALGKHHEDREDYASAMDFYTRGNRLRKAQLRYDPDSMTRRMALQKEHCTAALFAAASGGGNPAPEPIFIVGLPRAGSTLIEQILASHSQIDGTQELPNIPALAFRLAGRRNVDEMPRYPSGLHELSAARRHELGSAYLEDTRVHRGQAPYFIDKMPNNFRHLGLIQLILPNAKIIDARRNAMACCFSGFKQLFASGQEFTYGLYDIGQYYRDYVDLMRHWDAVLPGKVLQVQYEDVVADLATQTRRILDYLGLPFEDQCVEFHRTERSIRTPSSEQVRQPIYTTGLEHWRHFAPWLEPLKQALGGLVEH